MGRLRVRPFRPWFRADLLDDVREGLCVRESTGRPSSPGPPGPEFRPAPYPIPTGSEDGCGGRDSGPLPSGPRYRGVGSGRDGSRLLSGRCRSGAVVRRGLGLLVRLFRRNKTQPLGPRRGGPPRGRESREDRRDKLVGIGGGGHTRRRHMRQSERETVLSLRVNPPKGS